jgi:predicted ArsR family transcriptional regulator
MPDPRAHRVLASVSRVAVLEVLRGADRPLGVLDLAESTGLHANTVRKHLDLLLEFGHVTRLHEESGRPGRPRQVYAPVEPDAAASDQRDYRLLASVLADHLRESADPQASTLEAGRRFGAAFVEPHDPDGDGRDRAGALDRVVRMLDAIGFRPELTADRGAIRLHHCPFLELARDQPDVVCRIHLGVVRGALEQLGAPAEAVRLLPFVAPGTCVVELGPPPGG